MKKLIAEYHSCYDELLSKLFLIHCASNNKDAEISTSKVSISLISNKEELTDEVKSMTAHEIIVYSLLLHKCIESQCEIQEVSYCELQRLRNKRVGNKKILDIATKNAYVNAIKGLCKRRIKYSLGETRKRKKITYREGEHPLLIIIETKRLDNGDRIIKYSLGPFGKTLIESKRYSTLVPNDYFQINFKEIMSYQIALYICRIIYIERHKKRKNITLKLDSVMKNTSKFVLSGNYGIVKYGCSLYDYNGENVKRYWDSTIRKINEILVKLKYEYTIKNYKNIYQTSNKLKGVRYDYQNVKWILEI